MALIQGKNDKKNLNVELNLLPVFDVLSVCICFLLMTVVLIEIRSIETKQAIGSESTLKDGNSANILMTIDDRNNLLLELKSGEKLESKTFIATKSGDIDWVKAQQLLSSLSNRKIQAAHILPSKATKYNQVIHLMDISKQTGIANIGLSPI